jgi:type IV pilus assembly protein PilM
MPFSPSTSRLTLPRRALLHRKHGWIGVDIGTALTKMAQVERHGAGFRITARWSIPSEANCPLMDSADDVKRSTTFTPQFQQARGMFRGRNAAAAVPASLVTHRCLDVPVGDAEDLRRMVYEEIEAERSPGGAERCFDFWKTPNPANENAAMVQLSILDIDRDASLRLAHNLHSVGLECRVLDGLPCALARSVQICDIHAAERPTAIIDIGYASTVFVVAVNGSPQFTRVLRGCGLEFLVAPIQRSMPLSATETLQLVKRIGIAPAEIDTQTDSASLVIHQLLSDPIAKLMSEITRTLMYLQHSLPDLLPDRVLLCGGGSFIPNLSARFASEMGLDVVSWTMSTTEPQLAAQDDSLFAVAAALSALAWEV